jgi:UPF0755 protein
MKSKRNWVRIVFVSLVTLVAAGSIAGWILYKRILAPNVDLGKRVTDHIYIPTGATMQHVADSFQVKGWLKDMESFRWVAERMNYTRIIPGKYIIRHGMNNRELVSVLRSGIQEPVNVTFNNIRTLEQFAGRIAKIIEADSASVVRVFRNDSLLAANQLNQYNSISVLIPNTYEMYWNTSAEELYKRMNKEFHRFWNEERESKLKQIGLSRGEVVVIASIVEQETRQDPEKPVVAGVYVNRFKKGWKLEADPTLIFAAGDFTIRRVLNDHKLIDSPYNTYMYAGLPPGPICIPGIASIDAVLNYAVHDYFYFCAKDDFSGYHVFAKSYSDHLLNAKRFHRALTRRGIMS